MSTIRVSACEVRYLLAALSRGTKEYRHVISAVAVGQHPHLSKEYELDEVDAFAEFEHGLDGDLSNKQTDFTTSAHTKVQFVSSTDLNDSCL